MEQVRHPRKALFILVTAVLWDGGMNLLTWLGNRHDAVRMGSVYHVSAYHVVADLVVGFVFGLLMGFVFWHSRQNPPQKETSRKGAIIKTVLFWLLMAFLAVLLWKMW